jgi:hypothetical protein
LNAFISLLSVMCFLARHLHSVNIICNEEIDNKFTPCPKSLQQNTLVTFDMRGREARKSLNNILLMDEIQMKNKHFP